MNYELIYFSVLYLLWLFVVLRKPRVSVLLLPLFFPMYLMRFDVFGVPVYFVEGLILLSAIPVFVKILKGEDENLMKKSLLHKLSFLFGGLFKRKENAFLSYLNSPLVPIVIFLVACGISAAIVPHDSFKHALGILKSWVIVPVIFFVMVKYTVKNRDDVLFLMYSYITSAVLLGFWALFQSITGTTVTVDARPSGPFESANYLVMYVAPAFVYLSISFIQTFLHENIETAGTRWNLVERKVYLSPLIALLFAVLVLSQSYAGIVGVFATLFIYLICEYFRVGARKSKKFLGKLIVFVITLLIAGFAITVSLNYEKFQNLAKPDEHTSIGTRIEIWKVAGHLLSEHPLLGNGLGEYENSYLYRAEEILGKIPFEEKRLHSHNLFLETWLNTGLLGLVGFVWLCLLAYLKIRSRMSFEDKNILLGMVFVLTYILLHGLIDVTFWKNDLSLIFFMVIGVIFSFPLRAGAGKFI